MALRKQASASPWGSGGRGQGSVTFNGNRIKRLTAKEVEQFLSQAELALAVKSNLAVLECLEEPSENREAVVLSGCGS